MTEREEERMDHNILDYGARGDGVKKCTQAIQAAVDACGRTGGRVVIPAGKYLSGGIRLRSNVELHLENGAELISTLEKEDMIDFAREFEGEGMDGMDGGCFLFARHEKNIVISGHGRIDGRGREVFFDADADNGFHECPLLREGLPAPHHLSGGCGEPDRAGCHLLRRGLLDPAHGAAAETCWWTASAS